MNDDAPCIQMQPQETTIRILIEALLFGKAVGDEVSWVKKEFCIIDEPGLQNFNELIPDA